jgi:DNA-binding MarR family transcriptional regulator
MSRKKTEAGDTTTPTMNLSRYYPYRLAVLSHEISRAFTPLYQERFGLSRQEWRVLAALGENPDMSAREIADYSTLEKMQVSRAVAGLAEAGLVAPAAGAIDRREKRVRLSGKGRRVYRQIIPLALRREAYLLSTLTADETALLDDIIQRLLAKARDLGTLQADD